MDLLFSVCTQRESAMSRRLKLQIFSEEVWCFPAGGTDIISCFAGQNPTLPVYHGEVQGRNLGMAMECWDVEGGYPTMMPVASFIHSFYSFFPFFPSFLLPLLSLPPSHWLSCRQAGVWWKRRASLHKALPLHAHPFLEWWRRHQIHQGLLLRFSRWVCSPNWSVWTVELRTVRQHQGYSHVKPQSQIQSFLAPFPGSLHGNGAKGLSAEYSSQNRLPSQNLSDRLWLNAHPAHDTKSWLGIEHFIKYLPPLSRGVGPWWLLHNQLDNWRHCHAWKEVCAWHRMWNKGKDVDMCTKPYCTSAVPVCLCLHSVSSAVMVL